MRLTGLKVPVTLSVLTHGAILFYAGAHIPTPAGTAAVITPVEILEAAANEEKQVLKPPRAAEKISIAKPAPPEPVPQRKREEQPAAREPVKQAAPEAVPRHDEVFDRAVKEPVPDAGTGERTVAADSSHAGHGDDGVMEATSAGAGPVAAYRGSDADEMSAFRSLVRGRIEKAKYYPRWARERGFEGVVGLRFAIMPDGNVKEITLVRPCHCEVLNRAACEAVRKASPYLPVPPGAAGKPMAMEVDIGFRLE